MISKDIDFETEYGVKVTGGLLVFNSASIFSQNVERDGIQITEYSMEVSAAIYYSKESMTDGKPPVQMVTRIVSYDPSLDLVSVFNNTFS